MIQIWGDKKCRDTQKAVRFFKERRIPVQYIELREKGPSKRAWESLIRGIGHCPIDRDGRVFREAVPQGTSFDALTLLQEHPTVAVTPLVRDGNRATCGYRPEVWKIWQKEGNA